MNGFLPEAAALAAIMGPDEVILEPARMTPYLTEPRRRFSVPAAAVALPRSVAKVQALARWAHETGTPLIPQGGNTGLVGGQVPLSGKEVIVSLNRLDRLREIDAAAGHMTLEAGMILAEAQRRAEAEGALFPLRIASEGSARIGGVLATNAGGVNVLAYGNARDLCLGIEAVLADGRLYNGLTTLRKDNAGYDLKNLIVGSEGTLAIITAATLKLFPLPAGQETAMVSLASPEAALELFYALRARAGGRLTAFELLPAIGREIQITHALLDADPTAGPAPWYALVEVSRFAGASDGLLLAGLEAALETGGILTAVLADSLADRARMWRLREQMSDCQRHEGASLKHDVSVPLGAIPELIARGSAAALALCPGIRPVPFGHMGDGNIHFNFTQPRGADPAAFLAGAAPLHAAIHDITVSLGGSIAAEHGVGQLKTGLLRAVKDPVALEMMRALKQALDPRGILNPGKVLD